MSELKITSEGKKKGLLSRLRRSARADVFVLIFTLMLVSAPMFANTIARANDARVVTIYADDVRETFPTDATTVQQALERAGISVGKDDLVEPSLETEITTDSFNINVYRARPVTVIDGERKVQIHTALQSPKLIAEAAGIDVYDEDRYEVQRVTNFLEYGTLGLQVKIVRSTPIKLNLYGTQTVIRTHAKTVSDLLNERGITPDDEDIVRPKPEDELSASQTVYVIRVGTDRVVEEEVIVYPRREIRDTSKPLGYEEILTPGVNGAKLVTYQITFENGKEVKRKEIDSVITKQPVEEVAVVGAKYELAWAFEQLRMCEAGGAYDRNSGNGYYGAYQFNFGTWQSNAPEAWKNTYPHEAPPSVQDQAALTLYNGRGWSPWPACSAKLGLL